MTSKPEWSRPRGIIILGGKKQREYKCPICQVGWLCFSDLKTTSKQVFCDSCSAVWVNPNNLSLKQLSERKPYKSEKDDLALKIATGKYKPPTKKPSLLRRIYLEIKWRF